MTEKDRNEIRKSLHTVLGEQAYHLELFGDYLAKKNKYREHDGMEAIYFYLIEKYKWKPSDVRAMNSEDIRFLLAEEMSDWHIHK